MIREKEAVHWLLLNIYTLGMLIQSIFLLTESKLTQHGFSPQSKLFARVLVPSSSIKFSSQLNDLAE